MSKYNWIVKSKTSVKSSILKDMNKEALEPTGLKRKKLKKKEGFCFLLANNKVDREKTSH